MQLAWHGKEPGSLIALGLLQLRGAAKHWQFVGMLHQVWMVSGGSKMSHMLLTRTGECIT